MYFRIKDHAQGFGPSKTTRFTPHNECDAFIYKYPNLIALELKSTKSPSLSFSLKRNDKQIKACQIIGLKTLSGYYGIKCGFLFNFRTIETTYYVPIDSFMAFCENTTKLSINYHDVKERGGIVIPQFKKRVHYTYDLSCIWRNDSEQT